MHVCIVVDRVLCMIYMFRAAWCAVAPGCMVVAGAYVATYVVVLTTYYVLLPSCLAIILDIVVGSRQ